MTACIKHYLVATNYIDAALDILNGYSEISSSEVFLVRHGHRVSSESME